MITTTRHESVLRVNFECKTAAMIYFMDVLWDVGIPWFASRADVRSLGDPLGVASGRRSAMESDKSTYTRKIQCSIGLIRRNIL